MVNTTAGFILAAYVIYLVTTGDLGRLVDIVSRPADQKRTSIDDVGKTIDKAKGIAEDAAKVAAVVAAL